MTVLLVDDDDTLRRDLDLFLGPDYQLIWASGSRQAMMLLGYGVVHDAVILDICLPPFIADVEEREGLELLSLFSGELLPGVPVLVLSSLPRAEIEADCLERGACAVLEKPCSVGKLRQVLKDLIGGEAV